MQIIPADWSTALRMRMTLGIIESSENARGGLRHGSQERARQEKSTRFTSLVTLALLHDPRTPFPRQLPSALLIIFIALPALFF